MEEEKTESKAVIDRGLDRAVRKRRSLAAIKKLVRWQNKSRVSRFFK
jgi:hypothetical protein